MAHQSFSLGSDQLSQMLLNVGRADPSAMSAIVHATRSKLYITILPIIGSRGSTEDVLQETFVKVWTKAHFYNVTKGSAIAWLVAIARNTALDWVRVETKRPSTDQEDFAGVPDDCELADELICKIQEHDLVRSSLESLSHVEKGAIRSIYWDGLTHSELAEKVGEPLGTVKSRIRRSLSKLRRQDFLMRTV